MFKKKDICLELTYEVDPSLLMLRDASLLARSFSAEVLLLNALSFALRHSNFKSLATNPDVLCLNSIVFLRDGLMDTFSSNGLPEQGASQIHQ